MDKKSSPAFTMSSRLKDTINRFSPGPMNYRQNLDIIKHSNPNTTIGKASRTFFKPSESPAPGHYDIQKQLRPKSSCAIFPTYKQPQVKEQNRKLGPGTYQPDFNKVLKKAASCCKFSKSPKNHNNTNPEKVKAPGPMTYNPKIENVHSNTPVVKFGHSLRVDEVRLKASIPGPGKYDTESAKNYKSQSAFKFSQQKRQKSPKNKEYTPGPLQYKIQSEFDSNIKHRKGFKISLSQRQHQSMIDIPGPTSYKSYQKLSQRRAPAFSIAHTQRKNILVAKNQTPGPNSYNPDSPPKKRSGSALITTSRRELQKQIEKKIAIPGPGQYEKAFEFKSIGSGTKFTIPRTKGEKQKQKMSQKRPSPWSYNPIQALKETIKYGKIGKSERQSMVKKGIPGPGDYNVKDQKTKSVRGVIIGSEKRSKQKYALIPGPGAYVIPSTIGNTKYYEKVTKNEKSEKGNKE